LVREYNVIDIEATVEIDRPVEEVFAFVADQTNAPRWQTDLHEVRRLTDGPIGVGTEHEFVRVFAGRQIASRNRFVEFEPDRYVAFEIPEGWLTGRASYLAEPSSTSGTVLTCHMQFKVRRLGFLFEPILKKVLARDSSRDEARLKALLEQSGT
jgi:uncharacterized protein YndB with AHSA1/START domain